MSLTHKERVQQALHHHPADHLPTQINYTSAMGEKMAAHFGISLADLPARLDNHLVRVSLSYARSLHDDVYYDWWDVGWNANEEGYLPTDYPLAQADSLDDFLWPDPHDPHLLNEAAQKIADDHGQHFIVPNFGFCLFERAWSLRGFEKFLLDLALNINFVEELLEHITDIQVTLARRFVALGVDGGYFGDDYGAQKGTLFSPDTWRKLFKPRLARMFAVFREAGLPVILHSDGQIGPILPDLVEIGLTTLNPVQPEVLDHAWLKQTFGDRLSYYGGVSTQTVLPSGTPTDVQAAAEQAMRLLAPHNTGLMLAPSHRLMVDVPLENVEALLSVFEQMGEAA